MRWVVFKSGMLRKLLPLVDRLSCKPAVDNPFQPGLICRSVRDLSPFSHSSRISSALMSRCCQLSSQSLCRANRELSRKKVSRQTPWQFQKRRPLREVEPAFRLGADWGCATSLVSHQAFKPRGQLSPSGQHIAPIRRTRSVSTNGSMSWVTL